MNIAATSGWGVCMLRLVARSDAFRGVLERTDSVWCGVPSYFAIGEQSEYRLAIGADRALTTCSLEVFKEVGTNNSNI